MGYLKEKVSYLKGLAEGMQLSDTTNEGKLLKAIIDVLDEVTDAVEELEDTTDQLGEQVDAIDEDLSVLEGVMVEDDDGCGCDDEDCDCNDDCDCDDECGCGCGCDQEDNLGEIECPHCNENITIERDMIDEETSSFICPECKKTIEYEWESDCDCGCECEDSKD